MPGMVRVLSDFDRSENFRKPFRTSINPSQSCFRVLTRPYSPVYPLRLRFGTTASVTFTCYSSVGSRPSRVSTWITPVWVAAARYELVCVRRPPPTRGSWARCLLSTASSPDRRSCSLSGRWFLQVPACLCASCDDQCTVPTSFHLRWE